MGLENKPVQYINVKLYELNSVRKISINLHNGKDRNRLKHIIAYEGFRLRKRDKERYLELLKKTKNRN